MPFVGIGTRPDHDIAYNNHDVDDGVSAGLFTLDDLLDVPLIGPILAGVYKDYPGVDPVITRLEAVRRMIGAMVDDVLAERPGVARLRAADALPGVPDCAVGDDVQLWPQRHGTDAMYLALLRVPHAG